MTLHRFARGSTRELLMDNERYVETIQAGNIKNAINMASWLVRRQSEIVLFRYLQRAANNPDFIPAAKCHIIDGFSEGFESSPLRYRKIFQCPQSGRISIPRPIDHTELS